MSLFRHQDVTLALTALLVWNISGIVSAADLWPLPTWPTSTPQDADFDESLLNKARDYALTGGGAGYVTRNGKLVMSWGDSKKPFDLKSSSKSIGVTALGLAILDQKIALTDKVRQHHPNFGTPPDSNAETGWLDQITIQHLATQTAGFEKPGGFEKLTFEPGTRWAYSDGGPNWLAECVTLAYRQDVDELMFDRVFTPLGISRRDLVWRKNSYRPEKIDGLMRREFGSGVSANVDAMARIGYLYLREGQWNGKQILSRDFVKLARTTVSGVVGLPVVDPKNYGNASDHYGLLWWNNAEGTLQDVPRDAFWSWGLYDSLIVVIPSLDIVVARAGQLWKRETAGHYDVLQPFLGSIAAAAKPMKSASRERSISTAGDDLLERKTDPKSMSNVTTRHLAAPYPASPLIKRIEWEPASQIVRQAKGSDNWPITWGDDDAMYTAYGDGKGFAPFVDQKLSLGLAKIEGGPGQFSAFNIRSESAEKVGDGVKGLKASGMLMVDGVLYMLVRNAENAMLAASKDHGLTWHWSDWKFSNSFGCPTFLNFGRNYSNARDSFVYLYSHDSDSAYHPADSMVLARVAKDQILTNAAYVFFCGLDKTGQPKWTSHVEDRAPVFHHVRNCYRSSVSYSAALKRYLWCQIIPGTDTRFDGGFGIYDAPEPWGPWTTVYFTERWDVGPGETSGIPTKWISDDGRTIHLVFSGDDCFSVRSAKLTLAP